MSEQDKANAVEAQLKAIYEAILEQGGRGEERAVKKQRAAELLEVSTRHISRAVANGKIRTVDIFGVERIPMSEIRRLLAEPTMKSNGAPRERVRFDVEASRKRMAELKAARKAKKP